MLEMNSKLQKLEKSVTSMEQADTLQECFASFKKKLKMDWQQGNQQCIR